MAHFQKHLRNTFLAGAFAAVPLAGTAFVVWYIDAKTRVISEYLTNRYIPFLGVLVALAAIYLLGLIVSSFIGRYSLNLIDALLSRVPFLRDLYAAWKHVALTPGGSEGTFGKVVLIPMETGNLRMLGFTSGQGIPGDPDTIAVFVPALPNPISGRLCFVRRADCQFLDVSPEEAFKTLLSTGNYVPKGIGEAMRSTGADADAALAAPTSAGILPPA